MPEEFRVKELIITWHDKSCSETDIFSSFVFSWFCFNAWIELNSNKDTDAGMMKELTEQSRQHAELVNAFQELETDEVFKQHLSILTANCPIYDQRGLKEPLIIKDERDFENIVWAIYRIRCNLFHGGKNAGDPRDQLLVTHAGAILQIWIARLIENWSSNKLR